MSPAALILAAGKGTRMKSELPKALHPLAGKPMVSCLIDRAREAGCRNVYVVAGHGIDAVCQALGSGVTVVHQKEQKGSGHAVAIAEKALSRESGPLLVLYCDTPLLTSVTLKELLRIQKTSGAFATMLSVDFENPTGYGRIVRKGGDLLDRIVEEMDADAEQKSIREVNVGCYVFDKKRLFAALKRVKRNPLKNEYYLTDAATLLAEEGEVRVVRTADRGEAFGVNNRYELSQAESVMQERIAKAWMEAGVGIRDPKTTFIDSDVRIGQDTTLLPHTVLEQGCVIGRGCVIGPFARIRGASKIGDQAVIGNFVEVVRSEIGSGTQIKHLSYIGDAVIGRNVNVGAGTITANYDGRNKHRTRIGDGARVGSGTVFVAPVTMGAKALTGAGAVVTGGCVIPPGATMIGVPAKELKRKKAKRK